MTSNLDKRYHLGSVHSDARAQMPEKQLFSFAEYKAQDAERIATATIPTEKRMADF